MDIGICRNEDLGLYVAKPVLKEKGLFSKLKYALKYDPSFYSKGKSQETTFLLGLSLGTTLRLNNIKECTIYRTFSKDFTYIPLVKLEEIVDKINFGFSKDFSVKVNVVKDEIRGGKRNW